MIRYYCEACGKTLKADDSIIGRKAECTRCESIAEVPPFSTRKSGEKKRASNLSDSIIDVDADDYFDDDDSVKLNSFAPIVMENSSRQKDDARPKASSTATELDAGEPSEDNEEFRAVFNVVERKKRFGGSGIKISPMVLASIAGVLAIGAIVFALSGYSPGYQREKVAPTAFAKTSEAIEYQTALMELKKSKTALIVTANGYLAAKGAPSSELDEVIAFATSISSVVNDDFALVEATSLYDSDQEADAARLIVLETEKLIDLRLEATRRAKEFRAKTYE